jgi:hypothetical protein
MIKMDQTRMAKTIFVGKPEGGREVENKMQ